ERVARLFEVGALLGVLEELAVEDDPDGAVLVGDGLLAVGEADDGEPAAGEFEAGGVEEPVLVGPAVDDRPGHARHDARWGRPAAAQVDHPRDPAPATALRPTG